MDQPEVHQHLSIWSHGSVEVLKHTLHQGIPISAAAGGVVPLVSVGRGGEQQRRAILSHHALHADQVGAVAAEQAMLA